MGARDDLSRLEKEKSVAPANIRTDMIWNDLLGYLSCILRFGGQWTCDDAAADAAFHFVCESCLVLRGQTADLEVEVAEYVFILTC